MPRKIKTADEVVASTTVLQAKQRKEKREYDAAIESERLRLEYYGDLRDDVMSLVRNSHMTYEEIHGRCGPHPKTLSNWDEKKVGSPQLRKLQATLRIIGYDIGIVEGSRVRTIRPLVAAE